MESSRNRETLDPETRKFILKRLTESETFERFLHTRYVAQKRFSVEGGESVDPGARLHDRGRAPSSAPRSS